MAGAKRIVCYAINGSGLGHLTRLISVARWLRRYVALLDHRPPEVIFLTSSDASDALARAGFAAFKIPSKTAATTAELNKLEYRRLAKHFVWNTLGVFSPDLFVVDTFPSGSFDELFQVLDGPFKKGFIYRNVKPEYAARPTFRSAVGLYDAVVVPHAREQNADCEQLVEDFDASFSGEVIQFERDEMLDSAVAREQLGVDPNQRLVYVSAGGGGDPQAESALRSLLHALQGQNDLHLLAGAGPLYRGARLSGPAISWFDTAAVWKYFSTVDVAVCAAGYNTFHELLFAQVPAVFFAQPKIADDQAGRVSRAVQFGACQQLSDVSNQHEVVERVRDLLDPATANAIRNACAQLLPRNGARECALALLRPIYDAPQLEWASSLLTPRLAQSLERAADGSTSVLPEWLTPLMPRGQITTIASHPGLDGVLNRLSTSAADEVKRILADPGVEADQSVFEEKLIDLLNAIHSTRLAVDTEMRIPLADDVLKTIVAVMKKQPLVAAKNGDRTRWICAIIDSVHELIRLDYAELTTLDVLQLCRMFPRVVDVEVQEWFRLFAEYVDAKRSSGDAAHEILRQVQVLKMTHPKMTRSTLVTLLQGATA